MAFVQHLCRVEFHRYITPTVFEVGFTPEPGFEFKGGQFVSIIIPGAAGGRDLRRAYSIASAPQQRPIELCVKLVEGGPGTTYLSKLKVGDTFKAFSIYGDFVYKTLPSRQACFVSTGTGIAPFRSMILSESFRSQPPKHAICMLGVRHENELMYASELDGISGVEWVEAVSRPTQPDWKGYRGRVTDWLRQRDATFAWSETDFYLCGSSAMIDEVKALLAEKGVQPSAIHKEIYYKVKPGE